MSSEVMDSLFTAAAAQNSAGDLGDHVKDHVNGAHGMLFDDMTPTTPDDKQDDGSSSLNPTAREFVPSFSGASPTPPTSNGSNLFLFDDVVVSQSPRKPTTGMETINVPSETEFDEEISNRPHELEEPNDFIASNGHNENGNGIEEALNPKEAAQGDEKSEDDYKVETIRIEGMTPLTFTNQFDDRFNQPEAMEESFYEEKTSEELNKVQILPVAEESSEQETPEEKDQVYGLNPFEATLEEISAEVENNLIDVTQQVAFEITTLLKEAQGEVEQIMEKKETIPEEEEPIVVVKDEEPTKVVADVDNFEDFERQMNEENQKHLEKVSGELLVPESSVDLAISPVPSMSPLPEPSVESEVDFVAKEDFVAHETSQPIVIEDSFVDLTKSPEPLETVVEHVEQFMVSPEPSPATVLIPETPVLESQPIVVDDEPAVIEREATPEPAVQEPVIDFESVAMDSSPVVEAVIEPEPVLIEAVKEAELPVEPLIDMVEPVVKEPTPEPVIEAPQVIAEQPQSTPEPQAIVAESPVAVAAVMEDEVKVSEAPKLIESIPDVIPKAEAAKVQEEEKKKAAAPVKKTTTTKTTAAPRPKTATTSAIAPKTATTKPAATAKSAPPTKTSPTTAAAKRAVPATTAPRSATTARPAPAKPASATTRPATAKPAPAATSRVTASRVTSATSKVSPTTDKAATGPKTTTTAKTTAAARPATASSRPASSTLASRKPLTSTTTRTATSAKAADDKNAPAKPASTLTKSTASSAARTTTTAAPRRPAQTATSAARAAKATSAGATATTKTTTATTKTSSTMKTSSTLATKKNLIKSPTSGAPASGKIAGNKPVMNGQQETVKAVENGTTNGHE